MPGLKQAGKISNDRFKKHLEKYGYEPMRHTPALWKYASHDIVFTLVVDVFGVKYTNRQNTEHLRNGLQLLYPVTTYWTGFKKMGLTLKWDHINRMVDISMPNYVLASLHKLQHKATDKPHDAPCQWARPICIQATQHANTEVTYPLLPPKQISLDQKIVGTFL